MCGLGGDNFLIASHRTVERAFQMGVEGTLKTALGMGLGCVAIG